MSPPFVFFCYALNVCRLSVIVRHYSYYTYTKLVSWEILVKLVLNFFIYEPKLSIDNRTPLVGSTVSYNGISRAIYALYHLTRYTGRSIHPAMYLYRLIEERKLYSSIIFTIWNGKRLQHLWRLYLSISSLIDIFLWPIYLKLSLICRW